MDLLRFDPELIPETARGQYRKWCAVGYFKQIAIASHKHVGIPASGFGQHGKVRFVTEFDFERWSLGDYRPFTTQKGSYLVDGVSGNAQLLAERAVQFIQHGCTDNQLVLSQHDVEDVCAQSSGRKRTHEYVGIESDLHETSLNTSSSVRYPRASAKGITRRRRSSNWANASWRRTASRTTSLRLRPVRRATRATCRSRTGSKRIVRAEVFMSCNVIHPALPNKRLQGDGSPTARRA